METILLNEYRPDKKFKTFPDLDARMAKHYDRIYDTVCNFEISPRYFYETGLKIGFRDIFYYIELLYDNQPSSVIDVGCAECIWKRWFPNIVGFDPNTGDFSEADFIDFFDEDFSKGHHKKWDNGMGLNSLHFIDWANLEKQLNLALNIVNRRFLFTFNFKSMKNVPNKDMDTLVQEFHARLSKNFKVIMFDSPLLRGVDNLQIENWAYVNGTVRFILEA